MRIIHVLRESWLGLCLAGAMLMGCSRVGVASDVARVKPSVKSLMHHAAGDVRETFLSWPMLVIVGGAGTAFSVSQFDEVWQESFRDGGYVGTVDRVFDLLGKPYVMDPLALAVYGAGKLFHHDKLQVIGETLLEALLFTDATTGTLKYAFQRERPNGGQLSFPSGHASTSFAVATVLQVLCGPKAGVPAYVLAGGMAFSRIDSNHHFSSDVVLGAALGSAIGWGTARFHRGRSPNLWVYPTMGERIGLVSLYTF